MIIFIAGLPKAGTTTLADLLGSVAKKKVENSFKEPGWFYSGNELVKVSRDGILTSRKVRWPKPDFINDKLYIDASPHYLSPAMFPAFFDAIKKLDEKQIQFKVIVTVRNPVDRAYSHFMHHKRDAIESLDFEEAISQEVVQSRLKDGFWIGYDYLGESKFFESLKSIQSFLSPDRLLIVPFSEISQGIRLGEKLNGFLPSGFFSTVSLDSSGRTLNASGVPSGLLSEVVVGFLNKCSRLEVMLRKNKFLYSVAKIAKQKAFGLVTLRKPDVNPILYKRLDQGFEQEHKFMEQLAYGNRGKSPKLPKQVAK